MKICMVNTFYPPWRGGAETYVSNLARNLVRRGHEVEVFCTSDPESPGIQVVDGVKVNRLKASAWIYAVPITPMLSFKLFRVEADILHANFPNPYTASIASMKTLLQNIPSVLTWHNDLLPVTKASTILVYTHDTFIAPFYFHWFDKIIATSQIYLEVSKTLQRYRDKVVVVPNGVDCEKFNPKVKGDEVKASYGLLDHKVILFVGALTKWHMYKGLHILLKAFKRVSGEEDDARLLIVGDGHIRSEYQRQSASLGLTGKVLFAGDVSDKDLPKYYAASDILILPSLDRSEGFGLTILEANASCKPAIGSNIGGIPSVIKHGVNGLLTPPGDEEALANAILTLLENEELARRMGRDGRKTAETRDWKHVAEAIEKIYIQLIE